MSEEKTEDTKKRMDRERVLCVFNIYNIKTGTAMDVLSVWALCGRACVSLCVGIDPTTPPRTAYSTTRQCVRVCEFVERK